MGGRQGRANGTPRRPDREGGAAGKFAELSKDEQRAVRLFTGNGTSDADLDFQDSSPQAVRNTLRELGSRNHQGGGTLYRALALADTADLVPGRELDLTRGRRTAVSASTDRDVALRFGKGLLSDVASTQVLIQMPFKRGTDVTRYNPREKEVITTGKIRITKVERLDSYVLVHAKQIDQ